MKVGFVGVGFMGRHMARNVLNGGHDMTVYDVSRDAADELLSLGATWANSPREASEDADVIFTSLPTPQIVEEVASGEGGILSGARRGAAYFDLSTTDPSTILRIAAPRRGQRPQSAGRSGVGRDWRSGGGHAVRDGRRRPRGLRRIQACARPDLGNQTMYCGPIGSGAVCKIVNNLIGLSVGVLLSEAFTMGVKWGVDAQTIYEGGVEEFGQHDEYARIPQWHIPAQLRAGIPARPRREGRRTGYSAWA